MTKATIYHNPRCSKSRQTLQLLEEHHAEITIIEYLKKPLNEQEIKDILEMLHLCPHELVRKGEALFKEKQFENITGEKLIKEMVKNPILIERPIVIANGKAVLGRPPENVLTIL